MRPSPISPQTISYIGRTGYIAKGIVYGLFGLLTLRATLLGYGQPQGAESAFLVIARQPFGRILLAIVAGGLWAFVAWRVIQLWLDPERKGQDLAGWTRRGGCGMSALLYLSLAFTALAGTFGSLGGGTGKQGTTAMILSYPGGRVLIILGGLGVIGAGLYQIYRGYSASFMQSYDLSAMSAEEVTWAKRIGRFGLCARGLTFLILGGVLAQAGIMHDSSKVGGLGEVLSALNRTPFGVTLFLAVATGFIAYGVYCLSRARYKQFVKHESRE